MKRWRWTWFALVVVLGSPIEGAAEDYFVRQTVGDDASDGKSAATAWRHVAKLSTALRAGDTAYVGPGLYREQIDLRNSGTPERRIVLIADTTGQHTGDPPGTVMITGAQPLDETMFEAAGPPGVYKASFPAFEVRGVVEMDGDQSRYIRADVTAEVHVDGLPEAEAVARRAKSFHYDEQQKTLILHTSDGRPPTAHEIEVMRRLAGISVTGKRYVTVMGFTFRHMHDAGITFFRGSSHGVAIDNVSWGSRQGIRVYTATDVALYGNTLFRNENSGVYFAADSTGAIAIGNVAYENTKGIRWGSRSGGAVAFDNVLFDNLERGISVEQTEGVMLRRNHLVNNARSQLQAIEAKFDSDENCFEIGNETELVANLSASLNQPQDHFRTLAGYQAYAHQDPSSREGRCGSLPRRIDVRELHRKASAYAEQARARSTGAR